MTVIVLSSAGGTMPAALISLQPSEMLATIRETLGWAPSHSRRCGRIIAIQRLRLHEIPDIFNAVAVASGRCTRDIEKVPCCLPDETEAKVAASNGAIEMFSR